jgi:YD repeat-containing protein
MRLSRLNLPLATLLLAACASHAPPATVDPATAASAIAGTAPDRPVRVVFQWRAMDGDARFNGQGVARIDVPYHARLDLFGPRGDTYLSAALVGQDLRLPPGVDAAPVPPPALMWAVLGVVAPPETAVLVGTRETAGRAELYYDVDGSTLRYTLEAGRVREVRWDGARRRMVVELRGAAGLGLPTQAVYRDFAAVTELVLNLESVDAVESFPPDIWRPGR